MVHSIFVNLDLAGSNVVLRLRSPHRHRSAYITQVCFGMMCGLLDPLAWTGGQLLAHLQMEHARARNDLVAFEATPREEGNLSPSVVAVSRTGPCWKRWRDCKASIVISLTEQDWGP